MNHTPHQSINRTRKLFLYIFWIVVLIILFFICKSYLDYRNNPNQNPTTLSQSGIKTITLYPNDGHNYLVNGYLNDLPVTFLVDTGASVVSIPLSIAKKLNLKKGIATQVMTANGSITVYWTKIKELSIGKIVLKNISGFINPHDHSQEVLLGMNALKHLTFTYKDKRLILKQKDT